MFVETVTFGRQCEYFKVPGTPSPYRAFVQQVGLRAHFSARPNPSRTRGRSPSLSVPAPAASAKAGGASVPFPGEPLPPRRISAPAERRSGRCHGSLSLPGCPGAQHGRRHARPAPAKRGSATAARSERTTIRSSESAIGCACACSRLSLLCCSLVASRGMQVGLEFSSCSKLATD
jgi:hypothetical protein